MSVLYYYYYYNYYKRKTINGHLNMFIKNNVISNNMIIYKIMLKN